MGYRTVYSCPGVWKNPTSSAITLFNALTVPAGELAFHPGIDGAFNNVVWTANATGTYKINATFTGDDFVGPTTTDVHVYVNGIDKFDDVVNSFGGAGKTYSGQLLIQAGQTVDFAVGWGTNSNYGNDTTGLTATISSVPLPPSVLLLGFGLSWVCWPSAGGKRPPRAKSLSRKI